MSQNSSEIEEKIRQNISDPAWRLANLYSIVDKGANEVPFTENPIQKRINETLAKRKIILKARQFGVSTNEILKMYDFVCWNQNVTACILAHEKDAITKLFRIVRRAWEFMDEELRPDIDRGQGSKYEFYFPKRKSRIYCDLESRGDTIHWLHISEAAFVENPDKLFATMQAVPLDGIITIETTPNGVNWFYDYFNETKVFKKMFFPWYLHDEYQIPTDKLELTDDENKLCAYAKKEFGVTISHEQIAFRRFKQGEQKHLFIQEYPEDPQSCFLSSGQAAMDLKCLHEILTNLPSPIGDDETLRIYDKRNSSQRYVIGADTAEGIDGDYCAAAVFEVRTRKQVAMLHGRWKPKEFAERLFELGKMYQKAESMPLLAVERNNHGHAVLSELEHHIHYPNIYQHDDEKLGWLTNLVTRPLMMNAFVAGVESGDVVLQDKQTVQECLTLVYNNGKIEAGTNKHDDTVVACAIAVQMCIKSGDLDLYENIGRMIRV